MKIKNETEFLVALEKTQKSNEIKANYKDLMFISNSRKKGFIKINNKSFQNIDFDNIDITGFDFIGCTFHECDFSNSIFWSCLFRDCIFKESDLRTLKIFESEFNQSKIYKSNCGLLHFADCTFKSLVFQDCSELLDVYWGNCIFYKTIFINSHIIYSRFEKSYYSDRPEIEFKNCLLTRNTFTDINFINVRFSNSCNINLNVLQNCSISISTFDLSCTSTGQEYNSIDFSTLNNSDKLQPSILKNIFGIINSEIKDYIYGLTNEIKFQSVFISYSFLDSTFAKRLNSSLKSKGVLTFMWEYDAPGGKPTKKIMRENVEKFDRVLFIASKHSVKSKACQYELTEGRKKQEKMWHEIYFPIHLDDYLFKVYKDDIRPLTKQDEYWENIQELRNINSVDFSMFLNNYDENKFEEAISKLVRDLKK